MSQREINGKSVLSWILDNSGFNQESASQYEPLAMKKTGGFQEMLFSLSRLRGLATRVTFDFYHEDSTSLQDVNFHAGTFARTSIRFGISHGHTAKEGAHRVDAQLAVLFWPAKNLFCLGFTSLLLFT